VSQLDSNFLSLIKTYPDWNCVLDSFKAVLKSTQIKLK